LKSAGRIAGMLLSAVLLGGVCFAQPAGVCAAALYYSRVEDTMPADKSDSENAASGLITGLLLQFSQGNREVEGRLVELVQNQLRRMAVGYMRRERGNHTLQATALVNEAWLRLENQEVNWQNRVHFFAVASRVMRQILVDYARRRAAEKRGGVKNRITLCDALLKEEESLTDVLALDEALNRLQEFDPRACRVVELHFFGGLSFQEIELILSVSARTIERDWTMARAWLRAELTKSL
jgi:RNA polymerase sigma-70 factor (ECF subfamily)